MSNEYENLKCEHGKTWKMLPRGKGYVLPCGECYKKADNKPQPEWVPE